MSSSQHDSFDGPIWATSTYFVGIPLEMREQPNVPPPPDTFHVDKDEGTVEVDMEKLSQRKMGIKAAIVTHIGNPVPGQELDCSFQVNDIVYYPQAVPDVEIDGAIVTKIDYVIAFRPNDA